MKHIFVVSILFVGLFSASALASERSAADELLALEKYRFNASEDIRMNRYRSGKMNKKILLLIWEILKELKENKPDELSALEKFRFNRSEDIRMNRYRSGQMNKKMLLLVWEILEEVKMNRETRMTACRNTTASGGDGK